MNDGGKEEEEAEEEEEIANNGTKSKLPGKKKRHLNRKCRLVVLAYYAVCLATNLAVLFMQAITE